MQALPRLCAAQSVPALLRGTEVLLPWSLYREKLEGI